MDFQAVYHQTSDNYCYPVNEEELIINIKTGYDVKQVNIYQGDPFAAGILGGGETWEGQKLIITSCKRLKNHLWWSVSVKPDYKRLRYYFELITEEEKWFFFEDGFVSDKQMHLKGRSRQFFSFPWINPCDVPVTPAWVKDTIWYQIFPDRFCNGNPSINHKDVKPWRSHTKTVKNSEHFGGDIAGITSRLDYLQNLGVTGIYLTPINEAPSTHKYDTVNYEKIDPHFGDEKAVKEMVDKAHEKGMRVMLDGVFNHCGYFHDKWQDVLEKGPKSEYFDWFMINEWPIDRNWKASQKKQMYSFALIDGMPKFNTSNPKVREYFINVCVMWVKKYGIDGLRLDVANEVSHRFCKELHESLKTIKPDIYILGEIWHNAMPWLRGDEFDSVMNYPLGQSIKDYWVDERLTNADFEYMLNRCYTAYMQQTNEALFNLLDSHDTMRLRTNAGSLDVFYAQLAILFAMPGSPCIYYGTELAMEGGHDPDCRRCMPWKDIDAGKFEKQISAMSKLIKLRKDEPAMRAMDFEFPHTYQEIPRVIQFVKLGAEGEKIELIVNCSKQDIPIMGEGDVLWERNYSKHVLAIDGVLIHKIQNR